MFLHELGHVLAGVLTGGAIPKFTFLSMVPHVDIASSRSAAIEAFRAASGSGLVLLLALPLLLRVRDSDAVHAVNWFVLIDVAGWILSICIPDGRRNDATHFLQTSDMKPRDLLLFLFAGALTTGIPLCVRSRDLRNSLAFDAETNLPLA